MASIFMVESWMLPWLIFDGKNLNYKECVENSMIMDYFPWENHESTWVILIGLLRARLAKSA